jgi:hypothetical protein
VSPPELGTEVEIGWHLVVVDGLVTLSIVLLAGHQQEDPHVVGLAFALALTAVMGDGARRGLFPAERRILSPPPQLVTWGEIEGLTVARCGPVELGLSGPSPLWGRVLKRTASQLHNREHVPSYGEPQIVGLMLPQPVRGEA